MGTRADYWIGQGPEAEWLGSTAHDGDWIACQDPPAEDATVEAWRAYVSTFDYREDWTSPEMGWPWPWATSATTDYAYAWIEASPPDWHKDALVYSQFGDPWRVVGTGELWSTEKPTWPDMAGRQVVTYGPRSGLIVLGGEDAIADLEARAAANKGRR